jgi:hypothetical protein
MDTTTHPAYNAARWLGHNVYMRGLTVEAAVEEALSFVGQSAETEPVRTEVIAGASTGWRLAQLEWPEVQA